MRVAEILLDGYGINTKGIRPSLVLDIIDGLLMESDIDKALSNIKFLTKEEFNGPKEDLLFLAKDRVLVKLVNNQRATKLYSKLLVNILLGTNKEMQSDELNDVFSGIKTTNTKYKVLQQLVDAINLVLDGTVIIYNQYNSIIRFIILKGNTSAELFKSLELSGYQSPQTFDKLMTICMIKDMLDE